VVAAVAISPETPVDGALLLLLLLLLLLSAVLLSVDDEDSGVGSGKVRSNLCTNTAPTVVWLAGVGSDDDGALFDAAVV
jgi:hypothetical protein